MHSQRQVRLFIGLPEAEWRISYQSRWVGVALVFLALGAIARLFVAMTNAFSGPTPGAELDALSFHEWGVEIALSSNFEEFRVGVSPYVNLLGLTYMLFGEYLLVGSLLSVLAWSVGGFYLLRAVSLVDGRANMVLAVVAVYSLLPSSVLLTAVTLREAFQMAFVCVGLYGAVCLFVSRGRSGLVALLFGCVGAAFLHAVLLFFAIGFALTSLLLSIFGARRFVWWLLFIGCALGASVVFAALPLLGYQTEFGLIESVGSYRDSLFVIDARTHYRESAPATGWVQMLLLGPVFFVQYLLEPLPWRASTFGDWVLVAENSLRVFLVALVLRGWGRLGEFRVLAAVLLAFFVLLEATWAVGTVNWGTAVRHHLPALPLLLMVLILVYRRAP